MIVNTISLDTSGPQADGRALRQEADNKLSGWYGDPLSILIHLETAAERQLQHTRDLVTDDCEFIKTFVSRNLY